LVYNLWPISCDLGSIFLPFFVENTELHIGPRPKNSIYSGGQTACPEEKKKFKPIIQNFGTVGLVKAQK
jgi:hypothetical protein